MTSAPLRWRPHLPLAAVLALAVYGQRETFNGCACKKAWDQDGTHCEDYCCNPGGGILWCEVEDVQCEDDTWGWCAEASKPATTKIENCEDHSWRDSDGDGCIVYGINQWCTRDGEVGLGWHDVWGNITEFIANGRTAFQACCACGGGAVGKPNPRAQRFTYGGCKCKTNWDEHGLSCASSCCNPDDDPAGNWCIVEDEACEFSDWGYCRPESEAPGEIEPSGDKHGHCTDVRGWEDVSQSTCAEYAIKAYCTEVGGYGLGWNVDWGNFVQFAAPGSLPANQACCACGGGTRDDAARPGDGSESAGERVDKVRATLYGCDCKKQWAMDLGGMTNATCDNYCCNPDADPIGAWCMVADESCEDADWGYCSESGLGFLDAAPRGPLQDAVHCEDQTGWKDKDGDSCVMYSIALWCTTNGAAGAGWHEEWGVVPADAFTACCACGGGSLPKDAEAKSGTLLRSAASLISEQVEHMWWVASGPCKMGADGCIMSGNFPLPYSVNEHCQIGVKADLAKPIHVKFFETEHRYDVMKVNGETFSGTRAPNGIVPVGTIHWGADSKDSGKGWVICPRGEVQHHNPGILLLKVFGGAIGVIFCSCCGALAVLWVHTYRSMPHGDGLGAGPQKIGKYTTQHDTV